MAPSLLYKLFISTIGSMPRQYDPKVNSWWGVIITEMGILDPFREENVSYFRTKLFAILTFILFLGAFSLWSTHKSMKKERDDAMADTARAAFEYRRLQNKLRDTDKELCIAYKKLRDANSDMDEERKEFRDAIQELDDKHLIDQVELRSLKEDVWNTECDRDEYFMKLGYASRENRKLTQENQDLVREKQSLTKENQKLESEKQKLEDENEQLEASLTEKDKTIHDVEAQANKTAQEAVTATPSSPTYISINSQTEMHQQVQKPWTAMPRMSDKSPEQSRAEDKISERDERIHDLEQQNQTLTSDIEGLRTDLKTLRDEHGKCNEHLQMQLAKKDEETSTIRAEKETAEKDSTETIAALRAELGKKQQEAEDANDALLANQAASADNVQRLKTLRSELEESREAHDQLDKDSAGQKSRIGELTASKDQLEDTLRSKNDEVATLQGRLSDSTKDLEELQKKHATCHEHDSSQALQLTQLRRTNESLQLSNNDLTQQVHSLKTNCPKCQELRTALDAAVADVKMSDDESRAEMKREVREELRSQVSDDLRRQLRVEIERSLRAEFQTHYSNLLASNSRRLQEQDRLIQDYNANLEKARNIPSIGVDHADCEKKEGILLASITKLESDAKILRGTCSRLNKNAQNDREQLKSVGTANEDLKRELETIKADQRRAQNINPWQSKLKACQRDFEKMKEERDKVRNNCTFYSTNLSDWKKKYEALEKEHATLKEKNEGERQRPEGSSPDDQSSTVNKEKATARDVARHEVDLREARDGKKAVYAMPATSACPVPKSTPELPPTVGLQPAYQSTNGSALVAGKKRERDEYSHGEVDGEEGDECKKVKKHHLMM